MTETVKNRLEKYVEEKILIQAMIFDMDGLLLDSERIVKRTWDLMGVELGIPRFGDHIYHTLGLNRKARSEYFYRVLGKDFPMEEFLKGTSRLFYEIVEKEGLPVKTGVKELLEYGRENGYRMAVATSSSGAYAKKVLGEAGIWKYFNGAVFGDMVTKTKPDPQIYRMACESIQVSPGEAMAFEDSPNGIRSAHSAGLVTVMVPDLVEPNGELELLYDHCLQTLLEAPYLLKQYRREEKR